ncbi:hypothetical protein MTR67_012649 [Solanum verrucosum]|uniref:Uncharacterized protein n=1 Tax=Solanum verrucosum TaxID=315347 RepID=A0AAF0QG26_SOLVR|nr:hypothetical protein MTR67_012649 [Solanum verrucosum]
MGISHSYELEIAQNRWHWKDNSKIFPTVSGITPKST